MRRIFKRMAYTITATLIALTAANGAEFPRALQGEWNANQEATFENHEAFERATRDFYDLRITRNKMEKWTGGKDEREMGQPSKSAAPSPSPARVR
jgi:hypothetical protein